MAKGIICLVATNIYQLLKIGKTTVEDYDEYLSDQTKKEYSLVFAIEVEDYAEKAKLLYSIFEQNRVSDTELFVFDKEVVKRLLSAFAGKVVFPVPEAEKEISETVASPSKISIIPDGRYYFSRGKKAEHKTLKAEAAVVNGCWTLQKGSILGLAEGKGGSEELKTIRARIPIDPNGRLLENFSLGKCSPSFAGTVVLNGSCNGWTEWKTINGEPLDAFRKK